MDLVVNPVVFGSCCPLDVLSGAEDGCKPMVWITINRFICGMIGKLFIELT